ncbi:hypothetical protein [Acaryochloris marina]|uniref:Uncharacterized protein n=1 Tax=Acaryochloris marina (strain MBIC 11017) TaxID=329726 RepID=B0CEK0_ACAM1|nr:hypothetical protein [Acaryochloris marina]ABW26966.1 hypothetical protein AM1_1949 [Acaryochloris marina MBIC11017]BDM81732.1 hypothetical protein AM10699_45990 [Acaryochloris marina MBIC10699]
MHLNLAMMMVWLCLGLSLGWLGLLLALTTANTLQKIQPQQSRKKLSLPFNFKPFWQGWSGQILLPVSSRTASTLLEKIIPTEQTIPAAAALTPHHPPLACELNIRSSSFSPSCCLLHTKQGSPLHGGAISTRLTRLQRMGVLL